MQFYTEREELLCRRGSARFICCTMLLSFLFAVSPPLAREGIAETAAEEVAGNVFGVACFFEDDVSVILGYRDDENEVAFGDYSLVGPGSTEFSTYVRGGEVIQTDGTKATRVLDGVPSAGRCIDLDVQIRQAFKYAVSPLRSKTFDLLDQMLSRISTEGGGTRDDFEKALDALLMAEATISTLRQNEIAQRAEYEAEHASLQRQLAEAERKAALLVSTEAELAEREQLAKEQELRVNALNAQVAQLREQLGSLQTLLDLADAADAESEARIESLGSQLNAALAREAIEQKRRAELEAAERRRLEGFRSEFFGRLREAIGDREGVNIVGDRFVFSSEVLFPSGSAELSGEGRMQIRQVAKLLGDVSDEIPDDIDWVIRVDGHTDDVPVSPGGKFKDNWELSQARALSVVRFMAGDLNFPSARLMPSGFGQHRPVIPLVTPEARAANRRIELKLTER